MILRPLALINWVAVSLVDEDEPVGVGVQRLQLPEDGDDGGLQRDWMLTSRLGATSCVLVFRPAASPRETRCSAARNVYARIGSDWRAA